MSPSTEKATKARCGLKGCDCGHTIEQLETAGGKLAALLEGFHPQARPRSWQRALRAFRKLLPPKGVAS